MMSQYCECTPGFTDLATLIEALYGMGFNESQVENHDEPQHLYGYRGDQRPQKAHVIIRRKHVGDAANDIGFELKPTGEIVAHISAFDLETNFPETKMAQLKTEYAIAKVVRTQRDRGRTVEVKRLPGNEADIHIRGYR